MDTTLAELLTTWWNRGDRDSALVLADRLLEMDSQQVAEVLTELRGNIYALPSLADAIRQSGEVLAAALRGVGTALVEAITTGEALPS